MRKLLVKVNNRYAPEYCLVTTIEADAQGVKSVRKRPMGDAAKKHVSDMARSAQELAAVLPQVTVCPCSMEGDTAVFPFCEGVSFLDKLMACADDREAALAAWQEFLALLEPAADKTVPFAKSADFVRLFGEAETLNGLPSYPVMAFDLTPSNVLVQAGQKPVLFDYEWRIDGPVPVALVKYHAITTTWMFQEKLRNGALTLDEVLALLGEAPTEVLAGAMAHFYAEIAGDHCEELPYFKAAVRYVKPSVNAENCLNENRELHALNVSLDAAMQDLKNEHAHVIDEWERTAGQLKAVEQERIRIAGEWEAAAKALTAQQQENTRIAGEWEATAKALTAQQQENARLADEWHGAVATLDALKNEHERTVIEWNHTAQMLQKLELEHQETKLAWQETLRRLDDARAEQAKAREEAGSSAAEREALAARLEELRGENARMAEEAKAQAETLVRLLEQAREQTAQVAEQTEKLTRLQLENERMGSELAAEQIARGQLEAELADVRARLVNAEAEAARYGAEWKKTFDEYHEMAYKYLHSQQELGLVTGSLRWKLVTHPIAGAKKLTKRVIGRSARKAFHLAQKVRARGRKAAAETAATVRNTNWMPAGEKVERKSAVIKKKARRLAIYFFYDGAGVVDDYVPYFLNALKEHVQRLVIVCNGRVNEDGLAKLQAITKDVVVRENTGFDSAAMKAGLLHVGWDQIKQYDEVLLTNFTFFGPVYPLGEMFEKMDKRDVDFWGMSAHSGLDFDPFNCCPYGCIPEHLQSYWIAIRRRMASSRNFREYWNQLPVMKDYNEAVGLHEAVFTRYFAELGYTWDSYLPRESYYGMTDNPMVVMGVEMIRDQHCPIFKRRAFFQDYYYLTTFTGQHTASWLMQYVDEETDYPIGLVWQNLIRTVHMSELTQDIHLSQILDKYHSYVEDKQALMARNKAALFMHLYDPSMAEELAGYAASLPEEVDIHISTTSEEKKKTIQRAFAKLKNRLEVRVCPNRGRDVSALLASFKDVVMDYDCICVTHDKKTAYLKPETVGEGFAYMGYENILASREFVYNVINAFDTNPYLGLLYAPDPNHADFGTHIGLEWGPNFECTKKLADELGLKVPMDAKHPPCAPFGSSFWIRTKALAPLYNKNWTYDDFPEEPFRMTDGSVLHAIERIYPFCAAHAGYYSALLMTTDYSAIEIGNLQFSAQSYAHLCFEHGIANRYIGVRDMLESALGPAVVQETTEAVTDRSLAGRIKRKAKGEVKRVLVKVRRKLTLWASV